ncbi:MAG: N-acetyltransferase [Agriterribacter sp.]
MDPEGIIVRIAEENDAIYAKEISEETYRSAIARGSGISRRSPEMIIDKIKQGKAIIAVTTNKQWAGFSYMETWSAGAFVSHSGLIVAPAFRHLHVATQIKDRIFSLSRERYPNAKIFSITTGLTIMKLNAALGFETVTFNELPHDPSFWEGCKSCAHYDILTSQGCRHCLCTALLFTPGKHPQTAPQQSYV